MGRLETRKKDLEEIKVPDHFKDLAWSYYLMGYEDGNKDLMEKIEKIK